MTNDAPMVNSTKNGEVAGDVATPCGNKSISSGFFSITMGSYLRFRKTLQLSMSVTYSKPTSINLHASFSVFAVLT